VPDRDDNCACGVILACNERGLPFRISNSAGHTSAFSRRSLRPSFARHRPRTMRGRGEGRVSADTHGPRAEKKHAAEPQVSQITGLPCAMVLTLIRALLGDRLACPRHPRARRIADLASAPGCQDHTTSRPRYVVRPRVRHTLRHHASTASHLACRDDRDTPLLPRWGVREDGSDLPDDARRTPCDKVTRRAIRTCRPCTNCPSGNAQHRVRHGAKRFAGTT